ncbi:GNAT family N-acetyltransferase [Sphingomonas sp. TREG-RG-20F-R18-01]|uniref:GNAT family N-acetyltransferase n=1 Tax=Sphingomonas sp. TREG-RG-20F-R18-01 TaxID=2914982 RepID=UPI001F55C2B4|nr:GNAT family N-acetyltransferase [Sphingomonas sp. TREG-RG-20F-R18-01]
MTAWTDPPTLVGQHVILRPTVHEDRDGLVAAAADGKISEMFFTNVSTLTDPAAFMAALFQERDYGRSMPFTVCLPAVEPTPPPFALSEVEGPGTTQGLRLRSARTEVGAGSETGIATPTELAPTPPPFALSEVEGPGTTQGLRLRSARTEGGAGSEIGIATDAEPAPTPPPFALSEVEGPGTAQRLRLRSARTEVGAGSETGIATPTEPAPTPPPFTLSEVEGPGTAQGLRLRSARTEGGQAPRIVGLTRYMRMNPAHRRLEIGGTFYAKSVQRSGVNTEAKLLLLKHAFEVLDCNAVQIRTDWFNKASQKAIERLGAKRDGVLRNHQLMDGRIRDLVVYSIIASEWAGVERNLRFLLARGEGKTA